MSPATFAAFPVDQLWVDTVGVQSIAIDWQEMGALEDGWEAFESPVCPECDEYGIREDYMWVCGNGGCDRGGDEIDAYSEGPMMNYYYPLPDLRRLGDDPYAAAEAISDLPLCVVQFGGGFALALTGGGMDLSWEICEAFTRLGFLPPLHFCDLPRLAGKRIEERERYVVDACRRSADVVAYQAQRTRERLDDQYPLREEVVGG